MKKQYKIAEKNGYDICETTRMCSMYIAWKYQSIKKTYVHTESKIIDIALIYDIETYKITHEIRDALSIIVFAKIINKRNTI